MALHIQSVILKTHKITGLIYHSFCKYSSSYVLLKLYLTSILPHFNYCSTVWSSPCNSINSQKLEKAQYFSLKVCSKNWSSSYESLLNRHIKIFQKI